MRKALLRLAAVPVLLFAGGSLWATWQTAEWRKSICFGSPKSGSLYGGKRPSLWGENFGSYSPILWSLGRTSMHEAVRDVIELSYADIARTSPELYFVYGESGWPRGGSFRPHRTHKNGLSVDFFVPMRDGAGNVQSLPINPINKFGYDLRLDNEGRGYGLELDFEAMAKHLDALHRIGKQRGVGIRLVIFETSLQKKLLATPTGRTLAGRIPFSKFKAWVPHDGHYHIDFIVPCQGYRG
jgi:penicillin-insensitive murein endopeptidase